MARKIQRSLDPVKLSQQTVEQAATDKFAAVQELAQAQQAKPHQQQQQSVGRVNPQLSCTVEPEDKDLLTALTLYVSNKAGKVVTTSALIRSLIRLGTKYKQELEP
jgi:hypothetical protein